MAVGDILKDIGINVDLGGLFGFTNIIQAFIFFLVAGLLVGAITFYVANKRQYNKKIEIFEEVNGKAIPVGSDKAREIVLPGTSIRAFFLQKRKFYIPRPSIQTGVGHYWYFIRRDGEWINIGLKNLNQEMNELKIHYDHTDMRMSNASLKKLIERNYKKLNWLKEYAPFIAMGMLIFMLGIVAFLVVNESKDLSGAFSSTADSFSESIDVFNEILLSMDNICSQSGIRGVT
ncbi:hypothetical protein LCGC14_1387890 [marine sediment metagenome]|uniref:Uncharacterized protein n=1 Tax=marine sediment metagenome TaxID=412755 RepID=A0A0F9K0Y7_9ZZZZ